MHIPGAVTDQTVADPTDTAPAGQPGSARVELSVFGRSVTVEAPETLATVAEVAERLWQQLETPIVPMGAAGFSMSEPDQDVPAEESTRIVGPYPDWQVRHAA